MNLKKIENKAKEYADKHYDDTDEYGFWFSDVEMLRRAYIASAKENGVIWHDLRKNPDDLPNNNTNVIVKTDSVTECAVFHKRLDGTYFWSCSFSPIERHPQSVIVWCEIPEFEVEE